MRPILLPFATLLSMAILVTTPAAAQEEVVNVYSARKEHLIRPLLDRFTEQTGIQVNLLSGGSAALLTRLRNEGRNTPADMLITVDAGNLHRAKEAGVLQPVKTEALLEAVPEHLRDPDGYWYGLSKRARVIFRSKERVEPGAIETYEGLADPKWRGRICMRSSNAIYNQSLVASMIAHKGVEQTEEWARGLVANFARPPQGGDTAQIRSVAAGECDITVANTYYYGRMLQGEGRDRAMAEQVAIVFPNQDGRGTHVNVSGGAVVKHAEHKQNAVRLLEFLVSPEAQQWYASVNNEYPVRPGVPVSPVLEQWGEFKADDLELSQLGVYNDEAVKLMDRVGWH